MGGELQPLATSPDSLELGRVGVKSCGAPWGAACGVVLISQHGLFPHRTSLYRSTGNQNASAHGHPCPLSPLEPLCRPCAQDGGLWGSGPTVCRVSSSCLLQGPCADA